MLDKNELNNYFICDYCHQKIDTVNHGLLEWLTPERGKVEKFHIVHNDVKCLYDVRPVAPSWELRSGIDESGFINLLGMIDEASDAEALANLLDTIERLTIPNYELVRNSLEAAQESGEVDFNTKPGFPSPAEIAAVLRYQNGEQVYK